MELTILLSKVFGVYFVVIGLLMVLRRGWFRSVVNAFMDAPALRFVMGIIMLFGGLFLLVSHQDWSSFSSGFISFLGWAVTIKGLLYMNLSNNAARKLAWMKSSTRYGWIVGLLAIALGLYLTNFAFNWF